MYKRIVLLLVLIVLVIPSSQKLMAYGEENNLYVNVGVMTDDDFTFKPFTWTAGVNLNIHLGDMLMLSPECDVIFNKFDFEYIWAAPGVLLNLKFDSFYAGAGAVKWFKVVGDFATNSDLLLKINAGFIGDYYRTGVYLETPFNNLFKEGMVIGFIFGIGL